MKYVKDQYCIYCGCEAECRDHVLWKRYNKSFTVPSCIACNSALGDCGYIDLNHRRAVIEYRYNSWLKSIHAGRNRQLSKEQIKNKLAAIRLLIRNE